MWNSSCQLDQLLQNNATWDALGQALRQWRGKAQPSVLHRYTPGGADMEDSVQSVWARCLRFLRLGCSRADWCDKTQSKFCSRGSVCSAMDLVSVGAPAAAVQLVWDSEI